MRILQNARTPDDVQTFLDANGGIAVADCYTKWDGSCIDIAPYV